jgi:hypothetical protein
MDFIDKIKTLYALDKTKNFGFIESEIQALEIKENIVLPTILKDYYLTLGKNSKINNTFNCLLKPSNQVGFSDDRHLVFYEENQSTVFWGIREADLSKENPAVYGNFDAQNLSEEWFLDNANTADFLLSMAFWNGVMGGLKYCAIANEESICEETLVEINKNWKKIEKITNQDIQFFTNDYTEIIALTNNVKQEINGLYIGSNNKKKYLNIINQLKISWDYRADED